MILFSGCKSNDFNYDFGQGMVTSNKALIKDAISRGANINGEIGEQSTPLIYAITTSKNDLVAFLLANGANPNKTDNKGIPPLHLAAYSGNKEAVDLLIKHGGDVNAFSEETDGIAIQGAILKDHNEIIQLLINAGTNLNITSKTSGNYPLRDAVEQNKYKISKLLIESGASVDIAIENKKGDIVNLVMRAVAENNKSMTKLLIDSGANLNARITLGGKEEWTVLFYTIIHNHSLVSTILSGDVDVNIPISDGMTPLHYAVLNKDYYLIQDLLKAGANCSQLNVDGKTPLLVAQKNGFHGIEKLFENCPIET
jgi:ankyrin repeat protein